MSCECVNVKTIFLKTSTQAQNANTNQSRIVNGNVIKFKAEHKKLTIRNNNNPLANMIIDNNPANPEKIITDIFTIRISKNDKLEAYKQKYKILEFNGLTFNIEKFIIDSKRDAMRNCIFINIHACLQGS